MLIRSYARKLIATGAMMTVLVSGGYAAAETSGGPITNPETNPVVARINDTEIDFKELQSVVSTLMPLMSYHTSVSDERLKQIRIKALDKIIDDQLIYEDLKNNKVEKISKKEVDEEIDKIKKRIPPGKSLKEMLKESGMTMDEFRKEVTVGASVRRARLDKREEFKKQAEETVTEEYLKDYYNKNLEKFKEPAKIRLGEILFKADPSGGQKVWLEAKKKAADTKARVDAGEDFAELAKQYSEDPYAEQGGDMGWAHEGSISPEIEEAIKPLKIGEVSGPVMSIYGYHIVKFVDKKPAKQLAFDELNVEKLKSELTAKESKRLWDEWIDGLRNNAKIELLSDMVKK